MLLVGRNGRLLQILCLAFTKRQTECVVRVSPFTVLNDLAQVRFRHLCERTVNCSPAVDYLFRMHVR